MPISRCPGQDFRYIKSQDVFEAPCPYCGKSLEFWKNDPRRRCTGCGKNVVNPHLDSGCAKWCRFAADCLGLSPAASQTDSLCQGLIEEMRRVFGEDSRQIQHALAVLDYAESILPNEHADPLVVKAAAVLHDIGIHQAEQKHGSPAGKYQEAEGPPIAREILQKLQVDPVRAEHVCRIVGSHHSASDIDTPEFRILWDADRLASAGEECREMDRAALERHVRTAFRTQTGRALAARKLLGG